MLNLRVLFSWYWLNVAQCVESEEELGCAELQKNFSASYLDINSRKEVSSPEKVELEFLVFVTKLPEQHRNTPQCMYFSRESTSPQFYGGG